MAAPSRSYSIIVLSILTTFFGTLVLIRSRSVQYDAETRRDLEDRWYAIMEIANQTGQPLLLAPFDELLAEAAELRQAIEAGTTNDAPARFASLSDRFMALYLAAESEPVDPVAIDPHGDALSFQVVNAYHLAQEAISNREVTPATLGAALRLSERLRRAPSSFAVSMGLKLAEDVVAVERSTRFGIDVDADAGGVTQDAYLSAVARMLRDESDVVFHGLGFKAQSASVRYPILERLIEFYQDVAAVDGDPAVVADFQFQEPSKLRLTLESAILPRSVLRRMIETTTLQFQCAIAARWHDVAYEFEHFPEVAPARATDSTSASDQR